MVKNFDHETKALTIQLDNWDCIYAEESNLADTLMHLMDADMYPASEEYCIGNALGMAMDIFDCMTGLVYMLPYVCADDFVQGKSVTLYGHAPTEENEAYMNN